MPQTLQDLPPKWAHFCLGIEKFVTEELDFQLDGPPLLVGLSGGIDSTALLLCLRYLSARHGGRVEAVHLNHQLRPEADADARWVSEFCASLGVPCSIHCADVADEARKRGVGLEEAGRDIRYTLYAETLAAMGGRAYVALGHHLDDLGEDVLLRLVRGAAWPGLSGMPGRDDARRLLRPLLLTPKATLAGFLTDLGIGWREDETNSDPKWARNRMRHGVLPALQDENPNFLDSIARLWRVGNADRDYWEHLTETAGETLSNARLGVAHRALRIRLYKAALDALGPGQALAENLFRLDRAWIQRRIGARLQFPGEKTAAITASGVLFSAKH
jgi:tRNA(Ile)-lysidine synthase